MRVSKWGDGLAVCLPQALVDELGLKEDDEVNVVAVAAGQIAVEKADKGAEPAKRMEPFRWFLPEGYKFDRDEAQ
jgi:antitoxin MazE